MIFAVAITVILVSLFYWHLLRHPKTDRDFKQISNEPLTTNTYIPPKPIQADSSVVVDLTLPTEIPLALSQFHLMDFPESNQEIVGHILKTARTTTRPHPMLHTLTNGIEDSEELYQLVKSDPEIAAKILQAVNSSEFYLTQTITRLSHAILYLGTNMVKNIALQCVIGTNMHSNDKELNHAFKTIWANGFLASSLAFIFAKNLDLENAAELATQTLLAYIGNLAIISYQPQFADCFNNQIPLFERVQIEQEKLGTHSAIVGSHLAVDWKLPQQLVDGIRDNLIPLSQPPEHNALEGTKLRNIVLCYICCRIAEIIMDKGLHDIAEVNLLDKESLELFYLPEYITMTGLQPLLGLLSKPTIRNEINKLIPKINNPKKSEDKSTP